MSICEQNNIRTTSNNYICNNVIESKYLKSNKYINVDNDNGKISLLLTANSSNHYLQSDVKAHCKGKWQDWFCIHNYHNNNNINNYPKTETMSIGVCYNYCELRTSQPKTGETITKYNKCSEYHDVNDIIYNPLALIAIFGTHFNNNITNFQKQMPYYNTINSTIGIRGSYLNDLYRVNKNNEFINLTNYNTNKPTNNQDKLLFDIIKNIVNNNNYIIEEIKEDIRKACNNINILYLKKIKDRPEERNDFLNKIKNYVFDIDKLEKIYGKDKTDNQKLVNIIAYTYNIMRLICYEKDEAIKTEQGPSLLSFTSFKLLSYEKIKLNIKTILIINYINKELIDDIDIIVDIFTAACYNCFNVNYDVFNNYRKILPENSILIRFDSEHFNNFNKNEFIKCHINNAFFIKQKTSLYKYELIYYNDVPFYDHDVLSEYNDNIQNIDKILLGILAFFIGVIIIVILYSLLLYLKIKFPEYKIVDGFIYLINFSHLFYKRLTLGLLNFSCRVFYKLIFTFRSKNTIISLIYKIINIIFIVFLIIYLLSAFLELLNIDYFTLLKRMNYSSFTASPEDQMLYINIPYYILIIYLILVYLYSTYIIKYSLEDSQFDIISNIDADDTISSEFIDYLLLSKYAEEMLKYESLYYEEFKKNQIDNKIIS